MAFFGKAPSSRIGTTQSLNIGSTLTSAQVSVSAGAAFGTETFQIRVFADTASNYAICDTSTQSASTASPFLPANVVEYVTVTPGQTFRAVRASTDGLNTATTTGTIWVTELS